MSALRVATAAFERGAEGPLRAESNNIARGPEVLEGLEAAVS